MRGREKEEKGGEGNSMWERKREGEKRRRKEKERGREKEKVRGAGAKIRREGER